MSLVLVVETFTEHNNSYLLAIEQLTWQVGNVCFLLVFYNFFDGIH